MKQLKLENQICFPFYAISRLITKTYKHLLDTLSLTYPQYLVLLVLWEKDVVPIKHIAEKLILETNTLTPLLKRMESDGLIMRTKNKSDDRSILVKLTEKGQSLQKQAQHIPTDIQKMLTGENLTKNDLQYLKNQLDIFITILHNQE